MKKNQHPRAFLITVVWTLLLLAASAFEPVALEHDDCSLWYGGETFVVGWRHGPVALLTAFG